MKKVYSVILVMVFVFCTVIMTSCKSDRVQSNDNERLKTLKISNLDEQFVKLNVYFDDSKNENEVKVSKEERILKRQEVLGELIIQELIKGPSKNSKLKPILPQDTKLLSFSIKDNIAYVNLSNKAKYKMTISRERACLVSIYSSLKELKCVNKIKILIDNKSVDSLGGNYNLTKPFTLEDIEKNKKLN